MTITAETPLHWAALLNQPQAIQALIKGGSDVNKATGLTKETPLHFAAMRGFKEAVLCLLGSASNLTAPSNDGGTALHYAAAYGRTEIVEILLSHGAEIDAKVYATGATALSLAKVYGHGSVTSLILWYMFGRSCPSSPYTISTGHRSSTIRDAANSYQAASSRIDEGDDLRILLRSSSLTNYMGSR